jgi:hypothetical protein
MRWLAKSAVQNVLSVIPRGVELNALLQRYATRSVIMTPERVAARLGRVVTPHVNNHQAHAKTAMAETVVFEIGTGFTPLVPVGLHLAGAGSVLTYDIVELTTERSLLELLRTVVAAEGQGLLAESCPWIVPARMARLRELAGAAPRGRDVVLRELGITYRIGDASATGLEAASVDYFVTNNVFEHIPREAIRTILRESARLGRDDAVLSHHIDLRDHYAKFDRKVDVFHSLRYSDRQWRLLNSRLEPQNRLRHRDYVELIDAAGFEIVSERVTRGPEDALARTPVAARFAGYPVDDLRVIDMWVVARKCTDAA